MAHKSLEYTEQKENVVDLLSYTSLIITISPAAVSEIAEESSLVWALPNELVPRGPLCGCRRVILQESFLLS